VTEHGYPSDPSYQYDPSFVLGQTSQAAYLTASIPTLIEAGAGEVFVTLRDNLGGQFASEGLLGGDVSDPPVADPQVIEKPAYGAVATLAECYVTLSRDCPGPGPVATPASLALAPARLRFSSNASLTISDPGQEPLQIGQIALAGATPDPLSLAADGCSGQILEPNETCKVSVRFAPVAGGAVAATLEIPSNDGTAGIPVTAVSPSVSSLSAIKPAFVPIAGGDGIGYRQRLVLTLANRLTTTVKIDKSIVTGADPRRFQIADNRCRRVDLAPGGSCTLSVVFTPGWVGTAESVLTLSGDGMPLPTALHARAFALSSVSSVAASRCLDPGPRDAIEILTTQRSSLTWRAALEQGAARCPAPGGVASARSSATGTTATSSRPRPRHYVAHIALPLAGRRGLRPGSYLLTVTPTNRHGAGHPHTTVVTVS
jgi:hypothetical protein